MAVTASGAEGASITADENAVVIQRSGIFARLRHGDRVVIPMREITGVHVDPAGLFRGFLQVLVGNEQPTTSMGANQHPRCFYFNRSDEAAVREVARFIEGHLEPIVPIPPVGLDTTGMVIGAPPPPADAPVTDENVIMAIASDPHVKPRLELGDELNRMRDALEGSPYGRGFELELRPAARMDELVADLLEHPPTILHFSGHGVVQGLILTAPDGNNPTLANPEALARMVRLPRVQANLRALVLNVCLSAEQAEWLAQWVPIVIGTVDTVPDPVAIAFTHGFYAAVGNRLPASDCFAAGTAQASLVSPADAGLYMFASAADPAQVHFH